jgi:molybdopterin-biosynthesis enzyme MoeA-like protein
MSDFAIKKPSATPAEEAKKPRRPKDKTQRKKRKYRRRRNTMKGLSEVELRRQLDRLSKQAEGIEIELRQKGQAAIIAYDLLGKVQKELCKRRKRRKRLFR